MAVAGRTGVALYSFNTRKWKLFGNETQEKDFVVTGGLLWWNEFVIMGEYFRRSLICLISSLQTEEFELFLANDMKPRYFDVVT